MQTWIRQKWAGSGGMAEVLRVAWPLILSNSFWTIQLTLDRVLLSRYSAAAVGAAQSAALLFWTPLTLLQFTANYSTTFVAQYTGAKQNHRVGPAVWQALYFAIFGGIAFLGMWFLATPLVQWAGHPPELREMEVIYLRCLSFSAISMLLIAAVSGFFAGRGDSRTVMWINAVGVLVNAPLTYAWIFGEWGFPAMGIAGAGWATAVGSGVAALTGLILFFRRKYREEYGTLSGWKLERGLFGRLLYYGVPSGMTTMLEALAFTLFALFVGRMGTVEMAATSIAFSLNLLIFLPVAGLGQAVGVIVGQGLGEDKPEVGERAAHSGVLIALVFSSVVVGFLLLFPTPLLELFRSRADTTNWVAVAEHVPKLLMFLLVYIGFDCLNLNFNFALRGAGDTRFMTMVMLIACWPLLVIPSYLAWYLQWGLYAAWSFAAGYAVFLGVVAWWRFRSGKWRSMRVIEETESESQNSEVIEGVTF